MKSFRTRRHVSHSAADMFALVCDVESYPKFVPLCEGMKVRRRTETAPGVVELVADMQVGFKAICERYSSKVICDANRFEVKVDYIDGPFRKLDNVVLTPHLGYVSQQNYERYYPDIVENIRGFLDGRPVRVIAPTSCSARGSIHPLPEPARSPVSSAQASSARSDRP